MGIQFRMGCEAATLNTQTENRKLRFTLLGRCWRSGTCIFNILQNYGKLRLTLAARFERIPRRQGSGGPGNAKASMDELDEPDHRMQCTGFDIGMSSYTGSHERLSLFGLGSEFAFRIHVFM